MLHSFITGQLLVKLSLFLRGVSCFQMDLSIQIFLCFNRNLNKKLFQDVLEELPVALASKAGQTEDKYKLALASGFVTQFFSEVNRNMVSDPSKRDNGASANCKVSDTVPHPRRLN